MTDIPVPSTGDEIDDADREYAAQCRLLNEDRGMIAMRIARENGREVPRRAFRTVSMSDDAYSDFAAQAKASVDAAFARGPEVVETTQAEREGRSLAEYMRRFELALTVPGLGEEDRDG